MPKIFSLFIYGNFLLMMTYASTTYACSLPKSHYKNVSCTSQSGVFLASKDDGSPVALLNKSGQKTADLFAYQAVLAHQFYAGLLPTQKNGKVGYINKHGKVVIAFQYQPLSGKNWARGVHNNRIIIKQNGGLGVIDGKGNTILTPDTTISHISDFKNHTATLTKHGRTYTIDIHGNYLDRQQTSQSTPTPPTAQIPNTLVLTPSLKDGKWGFVDSQGTPMIVHTFDEVKPYQEGLAAVRMGDNWGFIDTGGRLVIDFRFHKDGFIVPTNHAPAISTPLSFINGKAWIGSLNNGNKLCINQQGVNIEC